MTSTELVGPLQRVVFGYIRDADGRLVPVDRHVPVLPKNTMDPRVRDCTDHHIACVCREALLAENLAEVKNEWTALIAALEKRIAGHPTYIDEDTDAAYDCRHRQLSPWQPGHHHRPFSMDEQIEYHGPCSCIGCQVWREARPW